MLQTFLETSTKLVYQQTHGGYLILNKYKLKAINNKLNSFSSTQLRKKFAKVKPLVENPIVTSSICLQKLNVLVHYFLKTFYCCWQ